VLRIRDVEAIATNPCPPLPDRSYLGDLLAGPGSETLTSDGRLILVSGVGLPARGLALQRLPSDPERPIPGLAGTRWVRAPDEAAAVPQASFVDFDLDGRYRMAVTCGTVEGTYDERDGSVTMTSTSSDLGATCDTFVNDTVVDRADLVGGRLVVRFAPTPGSGTDPVVRTYVPIDDLDVPSADDLVGRWTPGMLLVGASMPILAVNEDGTADVGPCGRSVDWSVADGRLTLRAPDDACVTDFGLAPGETTLDVRLDGEALTLSGPDTVVRFQRVGYLADAVPVTEGATLDGPLTAGGTFEVSQSAEDGLCLVLAGEDFGCDTAGPVAPVGSFQPRVAVSDDAPGSGALLAFGLLPPSATSVDAPGAVVGSGMWAIPLAGGRSPVAVTYLSADGDVVQRWNLAGWG
jgi:hypothetical protein